MFTAGSSLVVCLAPATPRVAFPRFHVSFHSAVVPTNGLHGPDSYIIRALFTAEDP